jgi:hypothetical protein
MKKKLTAVDWFSNQSYELFEQYSEGKFDRIQLNKLMLVATDKAKEMEKEQMIEFAQEVFRNRYNQITQSLGNIADEIYNETYGK